MLRKQISTFLLKYISERLLLQNHLLYKSVTKKEVVFEHYYVIIQYFCFQSSMFDYYIDKYNYNVILLFHRKNLSNSHVVGCSSSVRKSVTNNDKRNDKDIRSLLLCTSTSGNVNNSGQGISTSSNILSIQHYTRRNISSNFCCGAMHSVFYQYFLCSCIMIFLLFQFEKILLDLLTRSIILKTFTLKDHTNNLNFSVNQRFHKIIDYNLLYKIKGMKFDG